MSPQDLEIFKISSQVSHIYRCSINFKFWCTWCNYFHKFDTLDFLDNESYIPPHSDATKALLRQLHSLWHMQPTWDKDRIQVQLYRNTYRINSLCRMYLDLRASDNLKEGIKLNINSWTKKSITMYLVTLPAKMSLYKYEQYCFAVARFCGSRSQGWSDSLSGISGQNSSHFHLLAKAIAVLSISPSGVIKSSFWFSENVPQSPLVLPYNQWNERSDITFHMNKFQK